MSIDSYIKTKVDGLTGLKIPKWIYWSVGGVVAGAIAWWLTHQDDAGSIFDQVTDAVVLLTSTDESRLEQMQADAQNETRILIQNLANIGINVKVGQTLRTDAAEKTLIADGATAGDLVTSWHEIGRAVDLYPLDDDGDAILNPTDDQLPLFHAIADNANALGFRSIAFNDDGTKRIIINSQGKGVWDGGHIEWRQPYSSISEAVAAEGAQYGLA